MPERIDHADEAIQGIMVASLRVSEDFCTQTGEHKADILAEAQVHATLALVEQQRIANVIALANSANPILSEQVATDAATALAGRQYGGWFELKPDIAAALGIKQEGETK